MHVRFFPGTVDEFSKTSNVNYLEKVVQKGVGNMSGRPFFILGRMVNFLICMAVISALTGCGPKISPSMSPEDLQTCDDTAATIKQDFTFPVSAYEVKSKPYLVTPGEAEISSPLYGSIIPYGEPVNISFNQPPPMMVFQTVF
jgi:hypothetical protein